MHPILIHECLESLLESFCSMLIDQNATYLNSTE